MNGVRTLLMRNSEKKSKLTKESEELALLMSKLRLGQDEIPFEDYFIKKN